MGFSRQLLTLTALVLLLCATPAWPCRRRKFNYDIGSKKELTALYNTRVVSATRYERPLTFMDRRRGMLSHSGVVIVLADGRRFLVHKGKQFGRPTGGQTVVTAARHMSSRWQQVGGTKRIDKSIVADYVKAGGRTYWTLFDNCHMAAKRMMALD